MAATSERPPARKIMPFAVRPLEERDIPQSEEIERDAFPTLYPKTSFRGELSRRLARYLVAWRRDDLDEGAQSAQPVQDPLKPEPISDHGLLGKLMDGAKGLWAGLAGNDNDIDAPFLSGFLGIWYMVDDAHIVSVGVRSSHRSQGIGELLLISALEQATLRNARAATLEVRVSNQVAQNLYTKYGFKEKGLRKRYYSDNGEDALIMTTSPIQNVDYQQMFRRLVESHEQRWGYSDRLVL